MSLNVTSNIGVIGYTEDKKFVAVAWSTNTFAYSTDGINWTEGTISDTSKSWESICYGKDKFVTVGYGNTFAYSMDGNNWTEGSISSTKRDWYSVCYGNGKFVAVAYNSNYFAYSTDGITWTESTISSTSRKWTSVCYGKDKFVAVAQGSTKYFAYSTDGINWTEITINVTAINWYSVCYGNGKFVAVDYSSNKFAYSTDGINWTEGTIGDTSRSWKSVCYGNGKFVAVAANSNYFAYSTDGMNWTEDSSTSIKWRSICYGGASIPDKAFNMSQPENASTDEFTDKVILDSIVHHDSPMYLLINQKATDNNFYIHSPVLGDLTLTPSDRKIYPVDSNMNRNCIGGKLHPLGNGFVAYSVYSNNMDATSKFSDSDTGSLELITGVIKANPYLGYYKSVNGQGFYGIENDVDGFMEPYRKKYGKFVGLYGPDVGGNASFVYSIDGITWNHNSVSNKNTYFQSICYGKDKFVAVQQSEYDGTSIINNTKIYYYSTDGITWTEGKLPSSRHWNLVCYGKDKFVAIPDNSKYIAYSTDGITWTEGTISDTDRNWYSICYGKDKFVTVGYGNTFVYSTDGINWTESMISSTIRNWQSICYGNDKFVAIAYNSNIFAYSTDGINWTESMISSTTRNWYSICYGNDKFVAIVVNSNYFAYSTDGITWTEGTISDNVRRWQSICYGNGKFIAVSNVSDFYAYSTDGITWTDSQFGGIGKYGVMCCGGELASIEFSNNHTGISTDVTDANGISTMTTYTEQYTEDVYYIHYAWVDRASSSLVRYNILTRKIDTSSGIPVISNLASYTTTFSIGTIAHPSFHKDKNGIHCAFYHGNTTYTKYYKLTRSGTDDSTWSWGVDSNTYITNENISLMVNKNENNLQSSVAQSARRMYMVNSNDKLVEFKKSQIF